MAKRISIINFKGGVGKTTVSLHLAAGLARYHDSRVLLVDLDHQSSLTLVYMKENQWEKAIKEKKTINSIFEHFTKRGTPLPGKDIIFEKYSGGYYSKYYSKLHLIPSELQLDETELDLGSTGYGATIDSEWEKRMLIANWIDENNIDEDYDYIIFDCPPATKIVTQNAIAVSHGYIIPTIPDEVSTRGIPHLIERMFKKIDEKQSGLAKFLKSRGKTISSIYVPKTKLVGIIIFRIREHGPALSGYTTDHTTHLKRLLDLYPEYVVSPYIPDGVGVAESMRDGSFVYDCGYNTNVINRGFINTFKEITADCKNRIDNL